MNILDYTLEQLQELSTEELENLYNECKLKEDFYHTQQYVKKIMINSLYGSVGNKNFILFNEKVAQAITGNGRFLVQNTSRMINDALNNINEDKSQFVGIVYNDTDSGYYTIAPIMNEIIKKNPNKSINEYVDIANKFELKFIDPIIQKSVDIATTHLNARRPEVIGAKREVIADTCFASSTTLRVKIDNDMKSIKIGELLTKFAPSTYNYRVRAPYTVDLKDKQVYIMSYNTKTCKNEMKQVLNVQKKLTEKRMVEISHPNVGKIRCTEDHKFAVKQNGQIIWKNAIDITETDDVIYNEYRLYSKQYCEDWDLQYTNASSLRTSSERKHAGNHIKEAKERNRTKLI